jgi:neutral ceramidase
VVATLPGEFTTALGRRIAARVHEASGGAERVVLVGLANEYASYFTTPEEYDAQHYEGGSTAYGAAAGPAVAQALAGLARSLAAPAPPENARRFVYRPGPARRFGVEDVGAPPPSPDDGLADVLQDPATGRPVRTFPCMAWDEPLPGWPGERPTPAVGIETRLGDGSWIPLVVGGAEETDEGIDLVTVALAARPEGVRWATFWMPPPPVGAQTAVRFRVSGTDGVVRRSPPFTPAAPHPAEARCFAAD